MGLRSRKRDIYHHTMRRWLSRNSVWTRWLKPCHIADWHISPLQRAQQTTTLLTGHLAPASMTTEPALAEQHFGDWYDQPVAIWQQLATLPKHNWSFITHDFCLPHGESFDQQVLRVASWCDLQECAISPRRLSWRILALSEPFWHIFLPYQQTWHKLLRYPILADFMQA